MNSSFDDLLFSSTSKYSCYNCISKQDLFSSSNSLYNNSISKSNDENQLPNKALLSFIILIGTCFISVALKRFRRKQELTELDRDEEMSSTFVDEIDFYSQIRLPIR
ncbi:unnamed protein product [Rotaria sp. Silwood1]|nr:unnamed protein product [Rotaria sp. Silwood1]CAF4625346.1 unnamed protein product [Rotaria sp. Silwood1]